MPFVWSLYTNFQFCLDTLLTHTFSLLRPPQTHSKDHGRVWWGRWSTGEWRGWVVGRQSSLSVCLFTVFATLLPGMCERIHTVLLPSIPDWEGMTGMKEGLDDFNWVFFQKAKQISGSILKFGNKIIRPNLPSSKLKWLIYFQDLIIN